MAQAQRKGIIQNTKGKALVTPAGEAFWIKVDKPDYEYNPQGKFEANLILDPEDANVAKFIDTMEKLRDRAVEEAKGAMKPEKAAKVTVRDVFKEHGEDNLVLLKTHTKAVDFEGNAQTVPVFNVKGVEYDTVPIVGNGSICKLQVWASPYHMASDNSVGISFKLKKVQVLKLEEVGDAGFTDESGSGFEDLSDDSAVNTEEDF